MKTAFLFLVKFLATVVAADFVAGMIHWLEDAYVREDTPLIGKWVARPNIVHHHYPRYMTRHNWWQTSFDLLVVSAALVIVAWFMGLLTWEVWVFAIVSANANEFYKWEHRTRKENGRVISFLQDIRVLQTARHHARHHTDPKNSHYCTITNFLNPVLDGMNFWNGLEWALRRRLGWNAGRILPFAGMGRDRRGWRSIKDSGR
jgi:ubiquitin-conjugating enzyme E2 variant